MNVKYISEKYKTKTSVKNHFSIFVLLSASLIYFNANSNELNVQEQDKFVTVKLSQEDIESLKLGQQINEALQAIKHPKDPASIHKITALGWDQRYYLMIRGWLVLQLQADKSIYTGTQEQAHIASRIEFIKKAIRTIDLE
ncbi:MAG: hypothetical protein P8M49_00925 [Thalassotalea sp.]|nr:hypothetical protein [Thalassotalea sp.]MDG2392043.1 hypothetical protein [Thalassotalea sp.]